MHKIIFSLLMRKYAWNSKLLLFLYVNTQVIIINVVEKKVLFKDNPSNRYHGEEWWKELDNGAENVRINAVRVILLLFINHI